MVKIKNFGSICSGIEAASYVLEPLNIHSLWLSEIADFPSRFLSTRYPNVVNVGDMVNIPDKIKVSELNAPDLLCGGTPCQAFSLAGWKNGLKDYRGILTLKYIDIIDESDSRRKKQKKKPSIFFWENVEGALKDKTNAFGCFLAGLAGYDQPIEVSRWSNAGILHGKKRNIAWRVLDAKYFGLPQQRRRIYLLGGGKDFFPENILFETGGIIEDPYSTFRSSENLIPFDFNDNHQTPPQELSRKINGKRIEIFRTYTDCLYSAYGTKWNGNAAAFNGSLFVAQDDKLRRLTPIECERLMGFPDNYTDLPDSKLTNRYQAIGNSWAVNVIRWIMKRLVSINTSKSLFPYGEGLKLLKDFTQISPDTYLNGSRMPYDYKLSNFLDLIDTEPYDKLYISKDGCSGILRRAKEHHATLNPRLYYYLQKNS